MPGVTNVTSKEQWAEILAGANDDGRTVIVNFTTQRCGASKMISPTFEGFSNKYTDLVFLQVDVDTVE
ncbi:hypothetical protein CLOM_g11435, partial [Closterium sp. NIES-68]